MGASSAAENDVGAIGQVAKRWTDAVAAGDFVELARLMTDDIIVIHGNGRTLHGRDAVLADLAASFDAYRVEQQIETEETIVDRSWAFERARVRTSVVTRASGETRDVCSRTLTILRKDPSQPWRIARTIGVVEQ